MGLKFEGSVGFIVQAESARHQSAATKVRNVGFLKNGMWWERIDDST